MKRTLISAVILSALGGCASTPVMEAVTKSHEQAQAQVAALQATTPTASSAPIILPTQEVPYLPLRSFARGSYKAEMPPALRSTKMVHISSSGPVTADQFARLIAEEFRLPVRAEPALARGAQEAQEDRPTIDLSLVPMQPLKDYLTTVTGLLGTDWDWQDGTLLIQNSFSRTYAVSISPDTYDGDTKTGKEGTSQAGVSGGGGGGGISGNFNSNAISKTAFKTDPWKDIADALMQIAGKDNVVIGKHIGIAQVTCSKACHRQVKQLIDDGNHALSAQVLFQVVAINVATTRTGESGVNWSLVYRTVLDSRKYRLGLNTPTSLVSLAAGQVNQILMPAGDVPNGWDGSGLIVEALSAASKVVEKKPWTVLAATNTVAALNNIQQLSYTGSFTVVPSTILGGTASYVGNPSFATFGQTLQVRPTVLANGQIRVSFMLDDTSGTVAKSGSQGGIPEPDRVTSNAIAMNQTFTVKPGSTIILSSLKRTTERSNAQGLLDGQRMGSETGSQEATETILLITPHIANAGGI